MKKTKPVISAVACIALAMGLTCALAPAAFAANSQSLTTGDVALTAQEPNPTVPTVKKVKLKSYAMGEITVIPTEPKIDGRNISSYRYTQTTDGLTLKSYTIRYSYNKKMKGAKTKTSEYGSRSINKLKKGKRVYVQIRVNMNYGDKVVHSAWSKKKSVKVDTKHKYTYALLKKPKYFNSWDECWAYCKKRPEVSVFAQNYIKLVKKVKGKWVDDTPKGWS